MNKKLLRVSGIIFFGLLTFLFLFSKGVSLYLRQQIPPSGKFISVNGAKVHYFEEGRGETILLIHGLNGAASNFSFALMGELARTHHVVAVDRPGSGYSEPRGCEKATLPEQATFISQFMDALQLKKVTIAGHSLGGAIALQLALDYPEKVNELKLLSPLTQYQTDIPDPFKPMAIRSDLYRWVYSRFFATPNMILTQDQALRAIFPTGKAPAGFDVRGGGFVAADYISFFYASCDLLGVEAHLGPLMSRYHSLSVPISILYGTEDKVLDHQLHGVQMKKKYPQVNLELIPGGHMIIVTDPKKTAEFISKKDS